ncbi:MAG TPA: Wzz/FepE/Etk N-terminal domain-containing protein, partial [Coriobacteriia bacterium]
MELKDYLRVIWIRKWLIITAVVVVTATAVVVSRSQASVYQGVATILISEQDTGATLAGAAAFAGYADPERGLQTEAELMQLRPLAERVIRKLDLRTIPDALMGQVTVAAVAQTNLVTLSVTDSTPQRAAEIANALAGVYVEWSRDQKRASITNALDEVDARLSEAKLEILDLGKKMNGPGSSDLQRQLGDAVSQQETLMDTLVRLSADEQNETNAVKLASIRSQIASTQRQLADVRAKILDLGSRLGSAGDASNNKELVAQLQIATNLYATLAQNAETLKVSEQLAVGSGSVVESAAIEPGRISPNPSRNGVLGLAVGLVFGLGIAFLAEYLDNTIKSTEEAQKLFGAPV